MTRKIKSKFTEMLLAPANVLGNDTEYETLDGIICRLEYDTVWNNSDGRYDEELDGICQKYYSCRFSHIRSIWFSRLGDVAEIWHLVKMVKL